MKNLSDLITLSICDFKRHQLKDNYTYMDKSFNLWKFKKENNYIDVYYKHCTFNDFVYYATITLEQLLINVRKYKAMAKHKLKTYSDKNTGEVFKCATRRDAIKLCKISYNKAHYNEKPKLVEIV